MMADVVWCGVVLDGQNLAQKTGLIVASLKLVTLPGEYSFSPS